LVTSVGAVPAPHRPGVAFPLCGICSTSPIFTHDAGVDGAAEHAFSVSIVGVAAVGPAIPDAPCRNIWSVSSSAASTRFRITYGIGGPAIGPGVVPVHEK
jgi:hypothetical protein